MAAQILMRADAVIASPNHDHAVAGDLADDVGAARGNVLEPADADPHLAIKNFALAVEDGRIGVIPGRKGERRGWQRRTRIARHSETMIPPHRPAGPEVCGRDTKPANPFMSEPTLRRELGKWDLTAIGVNQVIGGAIFLMPAIVAAQIGAWSWIGVAIAGVMSMAIALNFAEAS